MAAQIDNSQLMNFLYTEIGRGHPSYIDGITDALFRRNTDRLFCRSESVFEVSGGLSLIAWRLARWFYRRGAAPGLIGAIYARLRREGDYNHGGLLMAVAGKDIRRKFSGSADPLVVAHPILVGLLAGREELIYQHGEMVAPTEALVRGASTVLVPTEAVADQFETIGYHQDQVLITGLCIEPVLAAQAADAYDLRLERYENRPSHTGAFFSSGAEPVEHITRLIEAAESSVKSGGRAVLFVRSEGQFESRAVASPILQAVPFKKVHSAGEITGEMPRVLIVSSNSRADENRSLARLFTELDYFVAPPHERSNYALGLGLPIFVVEPTYGSFAPLNLEHVLRNQVGRRLSDIDDFGSELSRLKQSGRLAAMAKAGWQKLPINGYDRIVDWLLGRYARE